jgi:hypothetical protein
MNRPNTDPLELQLSRLEYEVSDDLRLLQEGGASYFSTEELRDLLLQWRLRSQQYQRFHYGSIGLGVAATAAWSIGASGITAYSESLFYLSILLLVLASGGIVWLRAKYESQATLHTYGILIQDELRKRRRKRDASFF